MLCTNTCTNTKTNANANANTNTNIETYFNFFNRLSGFVVVINLLMEQCGELGIAEPIARLFGSFLNILSMFVLLYSGQCAVRLF
jgi:hypothetical protein